MESCAHPGCHDYLAGKLGDCDPAEQTERQALADTAPGSLPSERETHVSLDGWVWHVHQMRLVSALQASPNFDGFAHETCLAHSHLYAAAAAFAVALVVDDFEGSSAAAADAAVAVAAAVAAAAVAAAAVAAAAAPVLTPEQLAAGGAVLAPDHTDNASSIVPRYHDHTRDQPEHLLDAVECVLGFDGVSGGTWAWVAHSLTVESRKAAVGMK